MSVAEREDALFEHAYEHAAEGAWLAALAHGAGDLLDAGSGYAYTYRITARLSPGERDVAALLRRGLRDKQIVDALGVSTSSVAEYTLRLRHKHECEPGEVLLALSPSDNCPEFRRWLRARLTPAEHAVACLLVSGESHAAIAHERRSAPRTIASQLAAVLCKAGVSGKRELVARWFGAPPSGK